MDGGPWEKKAQPRLKDNERVVIRGKVIKFVKKAYLTPPLGRIRSVIKYFAVPKGVLEDVVQDWRVVFHAGANKLNDCVWAPPFSLPSTSSLLCILDSNSLQQDKDMGEMFLNFQLDPKIQQFAAIDILPLEIPTTECEHRWLCWNRMLMGFRAPPYNAIKVYLIAEEIIRGDRHDQTNAFQFDHVRLNLPGTSKYNPTEGWVSKRRKDGSLASDFVCFVNDQRVTGEGKEGVAAAGHAISTRESYLVGGTVGS
jgi:hypothetical protein